MSDGSMWATVFMAPGQLSFRRMPVPEVGPEDILVKIETALTCGTDVKTYKRGHPKYDPPTLFGHEFAGDVVAVGGDVKGFEAGVRVVAGNTAPCNRCYYCKRGQPNLCEDLLVNLGAFAEYIHVYITYFVGNPLGLFRLFGARFTFLLERLHLTFKLFEQFLLFLDFTLKLLET